MSARATPSQAWSPEDPARVALVCGALAALVAVGHLVLAAITVRAWSDGVIGPLMPLCKTTAALGFAFVAQRTFAGRRWAASWGPAFVLVWAPGNVRWAMAGPAWLWIVVALEAVYALAAFASRELFPAEPRFVQRRVRARVVLLLLVAAAAEVYGRVESPGSERGRRGVVEEFERAYHKAGARDVRVEAHDLELRIVSPTDPDDKIEAFAKLLRQQLATAGPSARAWLVGFNVVTVTNGKHVVALPAAEFQGEPASPARDR